MVYVLDDNYKTLGELLDSAMRILVNDPTRLDEIDDVEMQFLIESASTLSRVLEGERRRRALGH